MPGVTAWWGLNKIIAPKAGETVLVTAATGAVGSVVGQLAKLAGARAIGVAGGPEKCIYATETLGYDACVDHKSARFAEELKAAAGQGIDGVFENVGGEPFLDSLKRLNDFARIAVCGLIASYEGQPTPLPDMGSFSCGGSRSKASSSPTILRAGRRRSANSPAMSPPAGCAGGKPSNRGWKARRRHWSTCCTAAISAKCWSNLFSNTKQCT